MGLLERFEAEQRRRRGAELAFATRDAPRFEEALGHKDSRFTEESYGNYIATSNDIYSVVSLRARLMSRLVLNLYRGRGGDKRQANNHPAAEVLRRVNPFWTWPRLMRMDELSLGLWGETVWAVERPAGRPSQIWWCKPTNMRPVPHRDNYLSHFIYQPVYGGMPIRFETNEIVWFRYPNPIDEFSALSPLAAARLAADTGKAMMSANRNLFVNGLMMGGLVVPATDKVTFSPDQATELEQLLDRRFKGVDRAHRWAVLRYEAQLKGLNVTPKDAEFAAGLNMTLRQVCNAYGVPSPLLNDLEHATLANAREFKQLLWGNTLISDADLKAAEIEEQFLPMFPGGPDHAAFDYSQVPELQEAASEVWSRERQAIESGRSTINEIRAKNGEPAVAWGDVWWAPVNKAAVTDADSTPQGDTSPTTLPPSNEGQDPADQAMSRLTHWDARRFLETAGLNGNGRTS